MTGSPKGVVDHQLHNGAGGLSQNASGSLGAVDDALKAEFRAGFYPDREADWIERLTDESGDVEADIAGCLTALAAGKRDFAYPVHDTSVYNLLQELVPGRSLKHGADIGCATGSFPAMQLAAGIEKCTLFEVRKIDVNDDRVEVRLQDLTYADGVEAEFDLVTCLSSIEHVGLGRYGDQLDPWGDVKMAANLRKILKPGGIMMISFPIGRGTVIFNAQRIYSAHRRNTLFGDLRLVASATGRSSLGQLRFKTQLALRRSGASSQPVYVLQKPV